MAVTCQQQVLTASSLTVEISSTLIAPTALASVVQDAMQAGQVQDLIRGTNHRLIQVDNLFGSGNGVKRERNSFRAVIADYTNGRTVYAGLDDAYGPLSELSTETSNVQHVPNHEEILEAAEIAGFGRDAVYHLQMPPVMQETHANGSTSRVINMIAHSKDEKKFTSVHVDMHMRTATVIQQAKHAATSSSAGPACTGVAEAQSTHVARGVPGAVEVKIKQAGTLLWELEVVRPSSSSGTRGSGIELLNVRYRNKLLLKRAHVPILNVNYIDKSHATCGPYYRDWQWQEHPFYCDGNDEPAIKDFRRCTSLSKTIVDKHSDGTQKDGGNFHGVAFDISGDEVVIRSQMIAGWYRYTSEWRLAANGTIMPRWGFGGVKRNVADPCVCAQHHHHVYWRLDFDIETSTSNVFKECDSPGTCQEVLMEKRLDKKQHRHWEVANTATGNYFQLYAGDNDGRWDPNAPNYPQEDLNYGVGDLWLVKYEQANPLHKYDDGFDETDGPDTRADFNKFVGHAGVAGKDIVVWYSAHFMHNQLHDHGESHVVGPNLIPGTWH